jgi:hypothetical protein
MNKNKSRPISIYTLMTLILFQGLSGLYGGGALVMDPTGGILKMPLSLLDGSPFDTYMIPGIILFLVLGVFPLIILFGLIQRKVWAWTGAVLVSVTLIIWIGVEIAMIGYHSDPPLQLIYGSVGIILLVLTQLPSVQLAIKSKTMDYKSGYG